MRNAIEKISGAVERVDNPLVLTACLCAAFFSQKTVVRVSLFNGINNFFFGLKVNFADKVIIFF